MNRCDIPPGGRRRSAIELAKDLYTIADRKTLRRWWFEEYGTNPPETFSNVDEHVLAKFIPVAVRRALKDGNGNRSDR